MLNLATLQMLRNEAGQESFCDIAEIVAEEHGISYQAVIDQYTAWAETR